MRHFFSAPRTLLLIAATAAISACDKIDQPRSAEAAPATAQPAPSAAPVPAAEAERTEDHATANGTRKPNLMGRIPILEYHLVGEPEGRWTRTPENFRKDLELLYEKGYRPVNMVDVLDGKMDVPAGMSPVVFTFDDASPSQFRYIERDGQLVIDPSSAVGVWFEFRKTHPDWGNRAVFCMLSGAEAGRSFFGDKGIEGQKSEWRFRKLRVLVDSGFELCNHTLWHANLAQQTDAMVMEQIARLNLAIDSAVPGYKVRTFALPLGEWPKNRALAKSGSWTNPRGGRVTSYDFSAVLQVAGGAARSPRDSQFDAGKLPRFQIVGSELTKLLDQLDKSAGRYVSAGRQR